MRTIDRGPPLTLAACGAVSGLLGSVFMGPSIGEAPGLGIFMILTGVWFALVVAYGVWDWGGREPRAAALAAVVTWIGWQLAVNLAVQLDQHWLQAIGISEGAALAWSGVAAGALGASVTWAGVAVAVPALREPSEAIPFVAVGAICGALLAASNNLDYPAVLFVPWQAAIGYMLGVALANRTAHAATDA
jgi:hypothetical protein